MRCEFEPGKFHIDFEDEVEIIIARSDTEFVAKLHSSSFSSEPNKAGYLERFAYWNKELDGVRLRHDTPENFVADLKANGYLKVEGDRYELHTQPRSV